MDPYYDVSVPFLNKRESFDLFVFFDGPERDLVVSCRHEGTECRVRGPVPIYADTFASSVLHAMVDIVPGGRIVRLFIPTKGPKR